MKIGAVAAGIVLFTLLLVSGCPKSNEMLDHSKNPGAVQTGTGNAPPGELTQGTPPAGGTQTPPPAADNSGGSSDAGNGGGGDTGGDTGGDDGE